MPLLARNVGCCQTTREPVPFHIWQQSMVDSWFSSQTSFLFNVVHAPVVFPQPWPDTPVSRAIGVFARYGLVERPYPSCPHIGCNHSLVLNITYREDQRGWQYRWRCSGSGSKHFDEFLTGGGPLQMMNKGNWMPFLNFIVLLNINLPLGTIYQEVQSAWGNIHDKTFRRWRNLYQSSLSSANTALNILRVGGSRPQQIVVMDETHIGALKQEPEESLSHAGVSKGAKRVRSSTRSATAIRARVSQRLPAKTTWKTGVMKRPTKQLNTPMKSKLKKKPAGNTKTKNKKELDKRSDGRWLWAAVTVGHGRTRYTHGNKEKKIAWRILPMSTMAVDGKPRGQKELEFTFEQHLVKGSKLVFDGWKSSAAAAASLGFEYAPPVVHDLNWRDAATGWHSNDIESEFNRLKLWNRRRHGHMRITAMDMHEYSFLMNAGSEISDVLRGMAVGSGSRCDALYFR